MMPRQEVCGMPTGEIVIAHQQLLSAVSFRYSAEEELGRLTVAKTASGGGAILLVELLQDGPVGCGRGRKEIVKGVMVQVESSREAEGTWARKAMGHQAECARCHVGFRCSTRGARVGIRSFMSTVGARATGSPHCGKRPDLAHDTGQPVAIR